jgi:hypothetical protein
MPVGNPQMLCHFRTSNNLDYVVMAIAGRLYASPYPFTGYYDLGVQMSADAFLMTHAVVERGAKRLVNGARVLVKPKRYLIIQDGVSPAFYWDGGCDSGQSSPLTNLPAPTTGIPDYTADQMAVSIPTGLWMAAVANRLFVANGEEIMWSDIVDPLSFYDMGFYTGGQFRLRGEVTGLSPTPDGQALLAFEKANTWQLEVGAPIKTESDWKKMPGFQRIVYPGIGCLAGNSFTTHWGELWWWSNIDLMSMRRAGASRSEDEVIICDLEMAKSRKKFGTVNNNVVGTSNVNYLLINTPSNEIWAKNSTPVSLLNHTTPPSWVGVWTGLRVKEFCSFYAYATGELHTFALSLDYDNNTRLWAIFNGKREDNAAYPTQETQIKSAFIGQAHAMGNIAKLKRMRWADILLDNLFGPVSLKGYYKGLKGGWTQILDKQITAQEAFDIGGRPLNQYRKIKTQEAALTNDGCDNCGQESNNIANLDTAFQLQLVWTGQLSLTAYRMTNWNEPEFLRGYPEDQEPTAVVKALCADPSDFSYIPTYVTQSLPTHTQSYSANDCTGKSHSVTFHSTISSQDALDQAINSVNIAIAICCPGTPVTRTYTSTQSYTAACIGGNGSTVTKSATATSDISQSDADAKAYAAAQVLANAELVCTFSSTQTATVNCPTGYIGTTSTATYTATSNVSQEDADTLATNMAQILAYGKLQCAQNSVKLAVIGGMYGLKATTSLFETALDDTVTSTWTGGVATTGNVYDINATQKMIVGQIPTYQGSAVQNIVKVNDTGTIVTWDHGTRDTSKNRSGYITCITHNNSQNVGIGGTFTDWDGIVQTNTEGGIENSMFNLVPAVAGEELNGINTDNDETLAFIDPTIAPTADSSGNPYVTVLYTNPTKNPLGIINSSTGRYFASFEPDTGVFNSPKFRGLDGAPACITNAGSGGYLIGGGFLKFGYGTTGTPVTKSFNGSTTTEGVVTTVIGTSSITFNVDGSLTVKAPDVSRTSTSGTPPTETTTTVSGKTVTTKPYEILDRPYLVAVDSAGAYDPTSGPRANKRTTYPYGVPTPDTNSYGPDAKVWSIATADLTNFFIAGEFTTYDGVTVPGLCRINDGSIDTSFAPEITTGPCYCVKVDILTGKVYVSTAGKIYRLNEDGTIDSSWNIIETDGYATDMCRVSPDFEIADGATVPGGTTPNILVGPITMITGKFTQAKSAGSDFFFTSGGILVHDGSTYGGAGAAVTGLDGKIISVYKPIFGNTPMAVVVPWSSGNFGLVS